MKRRIAAMLVLVALVAAPIDVFAGSVRTCLEGYYDGHYGNVCTVKAGKSKTVQFYEAEDNGKDLKFDKKIKATKSNFAVEDYNGNKTKLVKLTPLSNGKMKITVSDKIKDGGEFNIVYKGSKYKIEDNFFYVQVPLGKAAVEKIKKSKITNVVAKSTMKGNKITFKAPKLPMRYNVYRSTKKDNGFKLVADTTKKTFVDRGSLKKGTKYYYKVQGYIDNFGTTVYTKSSGVCNTNAKKTFPKMIAKDMTKANLDAHDKSLVKDAYIFGLPEGIKFDYSGVSFDAMLNNLQYAFLIGDYELGFAYSDVDKADEALRMIDDILNSEEYDGVFADLFCAYANGGNDYNMTYENGSYCIYLSIEDAAISDARIFKNQKMAVKRVKEIAQEMRDLGKIKDGMSQKEIAQVYYDYVSTAEVGCLDFSADGFHDGMCMTEDTPYSFLFDKMASCLGHTATYNQLLHYEGIQAYGAVNWASQVEGENGHILSYIVCDGQEYFTDTTGSIPMTDLEDMKKHVIFRSDSVEKVRKAAGMTAAS